jgi:hypothetical protein
MNDGIEAMNDGNMTKHEAKIWGSDEVVTRQHARQCGGSNKVVQGSIRVMTKQHKVTMRQQVEVAQGMVRRGGNNKARGKNQRKEPKGGKKKNEREKKQGKKRKVKRKGTFFLRIQIQNLNNTKTQNIIEHNTHNTHNLCEHK